MEFSPSAQWAVGAVPIALSEKKRRGSGGSTAPDRTKVRALIDTQLDALRTVACQAADRAIELRSTLAPEPSHR